VVRKTCPFRPCCGVFQFPEIAGTDKEACAKLIADLEASGAAAVMKTLDSSLRALIHKSLKGNKDEAIRARVNGEDDLSKKYLNRLKTMNKELEPPSDLNVRTLWLGNLDFQVISREQLYDLLYSHGHIINIQCFPVGNYAFVEFASREQAELAAKSLSNGLYIFDRKVSVNWAKARTQGSSSSSAGQSGDMPMPAPPGMESAPSSAYAIPNLPAPVIPAPPPPRPPTAPHPSTLSKSDADATGSNAVSEVAAREGSNSSSTGKRKLSGDDVDDTVDRKRRGQDSGDPSADSDRVGTV
jgi:RNA recognition motif-containing protein